MAYLEKEHENVLKTLLEKEINVTTDPDRLHLLKNTLAAVEADHFETSTENNILSVADDFEELQQEGAELTEEEISDLVHRMMGYDDTEYNEYVSILIRDVISKRGTKA